MRLRFRTLLAILTALLTALPGCAKEPVRYSVRPEQTLKHDSGAYTQGLFFHKGKLYESTGQYGESSMRVVDLASGQVLRQKSFPRKYFIEGSCILGGKLYVLTWRERTCFILDPDTFEQKGTFAYQGEGWGLTTDGKHLIMSDGGSSLYFRDPATFKIARKIDVTYKEKPLEFLNELEYIDGEIWANVYGSEVIVRIDPSSGKVKSLVDCTGILPAGLRKPTTDVFNGIAVNPDTGYIYVTGKYWPQMYRITLIENKKK